MQSPAFILTLVAMALLFMMNVSFNGYGDNIMLANAEKKTDILFLKGKFILKNKKGSIVVADDKKCHCPHYY